MTPNAPPHPKPLLLCLSHLRWNSVVQRPHHLMRLASATHRVLFWEEPHQVPAAAEPHRPLRHEAAPDLLVVTPLVTSGKDLAARDAEQRHQLDTLIAEHGGLVDLAWFYTPMMLPVAAHLQPGVTVHDCMDELSAFLGAAPQLALLERRLLRRSDLVFTGGRSLFAAKNPLHPDVHLFPSSVDAAHFAAARTDLPEPPDQAPIPAPRIGFHGVIDERMDLALLAALAARRPDWHFIMLGPIVKIDPASLPRPANIHWLGAKPYADLPAYLSGWDAGFMPFALNDATRFISPTKTPEFLAAGLPVVSTPVPDVVHDYGRDGLVEIAATAEDFAHALARTMARPAAGWLAMVEDRLRTTSWHATWARMSLLIAAARQASPHTAEAGSR